MQKAVYAMTDHEQVSEKAGARVGRSWSGEPVKRDSLGGNFFETQHSAGEALITDANAIMIKRSGSRGRERCTMVRGVRGPLPTKPAQENLCRTGRRWKEINARSELKLL